MIDIGTCVGPYEVTALLGEGGMGRVWRARHAALQRDDALKVLPELFAADPDRLARFEREAQILAALNHPNIAQVYGLQQADGVRALVMELVEGPTLADRIVHGPISIKEALAIAVQVASGLEAAHERGVVHRDLKPANIKVRADGTVKILDFGLAKAMEGPSRGGPSTGVTQSPTITSPAVTGQGVILGTAAYMSPEQASGAHVDQRADIWAFGCVLYEMLTRKPVFSGDSVARVLAKVLERDPDFDALRAATPPRIARLIRRCLEKDPKKRLHAIADARLEIEDVAGDDLSSATPDDRSRRRASIVAWASGAFVLGAAVASTLWLLMPSRPPAPQPVVRSTVATVPVVEGRLDRFGGVAIAPDGRRITYSAREALLLRSLDDVEPRPLRGAEGGIFPAFSPDGASIAFFVPSESAIKRVSVDGGPAFVIANADGSPAGLSWGPDDTIVFATSTSGGLWRVRATGGRPERLTTVEAGQAIFHGRPDILPNGRGVVFTAFRGGTSRISVLSFDTRDVTDIAPGADPRFAPTGHIVYQDLGVLRAVGFDPARFAVTTDSVPLSASVPRTSSALFDISASGSFVYVPTITDTAGTLVWVDRTGREEPIDLPPRNYDTLRVSPDGSRIVADIAEAERAPEIFVSDVKRPEWTKLPTPDHDGGDWFPWWTPDGTRILFPIFFDSDAPPGLFWTTADGTGSVDELLTIADNSFLDARGWTPDGRSLLFTYGNPQGDPRIGLLSMGTGKDGTHSWEPLVERVGGALAGPISPDGNWLVTESAGSAGVTNIYIERFPSLGDRRLVSAQGGGVNAVWSPDGRELFYVRVSDQAMMAVPIQTSPTLVVGTPQVLFRRRNYATTQPSRRWDVAPDGRFLMIRSAAPPATEAPVVLVQHWFDELRRLVPTAPR